MAGNMILSMVELVVSFGLVVLIWLIQLLHYPSFRFIDQSKFTQFARFHGTRISYIVIPLMLLELALGLYFHHLVIILILISIWLSTFLLQVPSHQKLTKEYSLEQIERLISTNWIRTFLWSLKFILLFFYL